MSPEFPGVDPVQFGRVLASVEALEKRIGSMEENIQDLLALANKSKGGMWAGMSLASAMGGVAAWVSSHLLGGKP